MRIPYNTNFQRLELTTLMHVALVSNRSRCLPRSAAGTHFAGCSLSCALRRFSQAADRNRLQVMKRCPPIAVKTAVIEPVPISNSSEYLATLKSRHSIVLNPQVEGQITNIFVKSGERVKPGTALMQIDPIKQQATVGSQEAARAAQEANVRLAQIQWERSQKLFDAGVISKQDFDQAQTNSRNSAAPTQISRRASAGTASGAALLSRDCSHRRDLSAIFPCAWAIA